MGSCPVRIDQKQLTCSLNLNIFLDNFFLQDDDGDGMDESFEANDKIVSDDDDADEAGGGNDDEDLRLTSTDEEADGFDPAKGTATPDNNTASPKVKSNSFPSRAMCYKTTVKRHIRGTLDQLLGHPNHCLLSILGVHFGIAYKTYVEI